MSVIHVKSTDEYTQLTATTDMLVIVDFSATWCGPCKKIAPVYEDLAAKNPSALFLHVDVDELAALPECQAIRGVPTFKFIKNGSPVTEVVGANSDKLAAAVTTHL